MNKVMRVTEGRVADLRGAWMDPIPLPAALSSLIPSWIYPLPSCCLCSDRSLRAASSRWMISRPQPVEPIVPSSLQNTQNTLPGDREHIQRPLSVCSPLLSQGLAKGTDRSVIGASWVQVLGNVLNLCIQELQRAVKARSSQ
jgi:hypothetical protein